MFFISLIKAILKGVLPLLEGGFSSPISSLFVWRYWYVLIHDCQLIQHKDLQLRKRSLKILVIPRVNKQQIVRFYVAYETSLGEKISGLPI